MNNIVLNAQPASSAQSKEAPALKSSNYASFFEHSSLAMVICLVDGTIQASNQAWKKLFTNLPDEFLPKNLLSDPCFANTGFKAAFQHSRFGDAAHVAAFGYGQEWLEADTSSIRDEEMNVVQIAVVFTNATEKLEASRALVSSINEKNAAQKSVDLIAGRLNMVVKAGNIGIWEWLPETGQVYLDETSKSLFGVDKAFFDRCTDMFNTTIHSEDLDFLWLKLNASIQDKKTFLIDLRTHIAGSARWIQLSGMFLFDENDKPSRLIGTIVDITDKVESRADQKFLVHASELLNGSLDYREILKALCEHAISYFCDGVFIDQFLVDGDMKRLMVVHSDPEIVKVMMQMDDYLPDGYENNPAMDTIITGKSLFNEDVDHFWNSMRDLVGEKYFEVATQLNGKSSILVRMKGRESILGTISFFTQKNSSKTLSKRHVWLAEELAYRASMAFENALIHQASQDAIKTRDEFLSIASHELKTPLQSLTLQNQMRKRNLEKKLLDSFKPEKISSMIDADLRHLMRINRLIDDMLDISRIRAGNLTFIKEKTDFCAFVKDVIERFRPQVESVGSYLSIVYCEPIFANIDSYRTEQVLVNLLTNAVKYGGGKPIKVEVIKKLDKIQVQIHDKGPGINEEDCDRIFERFERAISSSEVSGLGLGLYISRQIMEQNQGSLFVRSIVGLGSTFIMELPFDN